MLYTKSVADTVNFLGISIVGHGNESDGPGGIFVGSVMKGLDIVVCNVSSHFLA